MFELRRYLPLVILSLTASAQAASETVANSAAPMFGLNFGNTGQSIEYGPTSKPTIAWKFKFPDPYGTDFTYGPQSLALGPGGLLYTAGLYALNSSNGSVAWHASTGGRSSHVALDSSGHEYAFEGEFLVARSAATGSKIWSSVNDNASDGDPTKIGPDGTVYGETFAGTLYAYTPSGQLKWNVSTGSPQYGEISHIPSIDPSNNIYYAGATGLLSLNSSGQTRWSVPYNPGASSVVMLQGGNVVWQRDGLVEERNSADGSLISSFSSGDVPQAMDSSGNLYLSGSNEIVKTTPGGQVIWRYARNYMDGPIAVDAAGDVYCGDQEGDIIGLSNTGTEMWEVNLSSAYPDLYNCAPVIGPNGSIYVEELSDQTIIALASVPEPSGLSFLAIGGVVLGRRRRSDRRSAAAARRG
jgi:hypothetical protein